MAGVRQHTERRKRWPQFKSQMMPHSYSPPEGHIIQALTFAIDPTPKQAAQIARFFAARRTAFNWTLDEIKADIERYRETGESPNAPSFHSVRKRWNAEKNSA